MSFLDWQKQTEKHSAEDKPQNTEKCSAKQKTNLRLTELLDFTGHSFRCLLFFTNCPVNNEGS